MVQLQLVEIEPETSGGYWLPEIKKVIAISTSYSALVEYCMETFGKTIGKSGKSHEVYYEIEETKIVVVKENK